jgi:methyl-accepting chemotaxis protein
MPQSWAFGKKVAAGFVVAIVLTLLTGAVAVYALRSVIASNERVIAVNAQNLIEAGVLRAAAEAKGSAMRGYLLTGDARHLEAMRSARNDFATTLAQIRMRVRADEERRLVEQIERTEADHQTVSEKAIATRVSDASVGAAVRLFEEEIKPKRDALDQGLAAFVAREERLLEEARREGTAVSSSAIRLVALILLLALVAGIGITVLISRALTRQLAVAIQHVQSSSTQLQASANQQAAGAKEQATAMSETSTTMSELLATSRQIAESARRVSHIAEETAAAAQAGDETVQKGRESIASIKRQVDVVVGHVLDLGKKSQQIGGILEIINELAEQTNILAINATIESAGAGEAGRRFAVVADEIRKLADRVGGSTKEIRGLIEEIRAAVSATVMATEGGSKAVDAGAQQFTEVTASFKQIASLVVTTTEAAREIELSTKQQTTSVEQVNVAITNVAQTTKEAEASSSMTFQTASQLTHLSRDLSRLIQPQAGA